MDPKEAILETHITLKCFSFILLLSSRIVKGSPLASIAKVYVLPKRKNLFDRTT